MSSCCFSPGNEWHDLSPVAPYSNFHCYQRQIVAHSLSSTFLHKQSGTDSHGIIWSTSRKTEISALVKCYMWMLKWKEFWKILIFSFLSTFLHIHCYQFYLICWYKFLNYKLLRCLKMNMRWKEKGCCLWPSKETWKAAMKICPVVDLPVERVLFNRWHYLWRRAMECRILF